VATKDPRSRFFEQIQHPTHGRFRNLKPNAPNTKMTSHSFRVRRADDLDALGFTHRGRATPRAVAGALKVDVGAIAHVERPGDVGRAKH
jgi:hypothetical protein